MTILLFELCEHLQLTLLLPKFIMGLDLGFTAPADPTCTLLLTLCGRVVRLLLAVSVDFRRRPRLELVILDLEGSLVLLLFPL
jgi:hypothetical protein